MIAVIFGGGVKDWENHICKRGENCDFHIFERKVVSFHLNIVIFFLNVNLLRKKPQGKVLHKS